MLCLYLTIGPSSVLWAYILRDVVYLATGVLTIKVKVIEHCWSLALKSCCKYCSQFWITSAGFNRHWSTQESLADQTTHGSVSSISYGSRQDANAVEIIKCKC